MGHSFCDLHYHMVFSTKGRRPWLDEALLVRLGAYFGAALADEQCTLVALGGTADHVHLLASLHQDIAVSEILRAIKANSSGWIHRTFPALRKSAWQEGYGAFSVSRSQMGRVRRYLKIQPEHHRRQSFKEEFVALLDAHKVKYDIRYLWA